MEILTKPVTVIPLANCRSISLVSWDILGLRSHIEEPRGDNIEPVNVGSGGSKAGSRAKLHFGFSNLGI